MYLFLGQIKQDHYRVTDFIEFSTIYKMLSYDN